MPRLRHHLRNAFIPHAGNDYRPHALRRPWLHTYAGVIVAVKVVAVILIGLYAGQARVSDVTPQAIITLTNQARQQRQITALKSNPLLSKAAASKAADMARRQYFAHVSPSGLTPWAWFKQAGYSYTYAGENLALDFVSSEDVVNAWLKSPSHRRNLLGAKYKDIGVAVATAQINGATSLIVVQMFGAPVPPPITKKVTVPAQTPLPAASKDLLAKSVPPKVLGEAAPNVPAPAIVPAPPTITTPDPDSVIRTAIPEVVGQAEPSSTVTLFVNGARLATAAADINGVYALVPSNPMTDGPAVIQVTATARGLTSGLSPTRTVMVDTQPPAIELQRSLVLPSYLIDGGYDVMVSVSGQPVAVILNAGGQAMPLVMYGQTYAGTIQLAGSAAAAGTMTVKAVDSAGNQIQTVLADPDLFTTGVVAATSGPFVSAVKLLFFSRTLMAVMLLLLFVMATLNVVIQWRHQHQPTIVGSLLVLFLAGTLLMT
ncbi:MAG: CAP domain-containing protein [Patescibacteria group bacterium]